MNYPRHFEVVQNDRLAPGKKLRDNMRREDMMDKFLGSVIKEFFTAPNLAVDMARVQQFPLSNFVDTRGQCVPCGKQFDEWHCNANHHIQKVLVCMKLNDLCGVRPCRELNVGLDLGVDREFPYVTQKALARFWGPDVGLLGARAFAMLQKHQTINAKVTANSKLKAISALPIMGGSTAVVPYDPNKPCYDPQGSRLLWWDCIPSGEEDPMACAPEVKGWQAQEYAQGQTWWPVVSWQLAPNHADSQWLKTYSPEWVTCIYQLMEEPLVAWPLRSARWAEDAVVPDHVPE